MYVWDEDSKKVAWIIARDSQNQNLNHQLCAMRICDWFGSRTIDHDTHDDEPVEANLVSLEEVRNLLSLVAESLYDGLIPNFPMRMQVLITCELVDLLAEIRSPHPKVLKGKP